MPIPNGDLTTSNTIHDNGEHHHQKLVDAIDKRSQSPDHVADESLRQSIEPNGNIDSPNGNGPPTKKRKLAGAENKPSPRPVSPPWKRVVADGPTSFIQDGRRKSGRTNIVPLEQQPQSDKRQTRTAFNKVKEEHQKHVKPVYNMSSTAPRKVTVEKPPPSPTATKRPPAPTSMTKNRERAPSNAAAKIESLKRQIEQLKAQRKSSHAAADSKSPKAFRQSTRTTKPQQQSSPRVNGFHKSASKINGIVKVESSSENDESAASLSESEASSRGPTPPLTLRKVTFRVKLSSPAIATPANIPPTRKYSTFAKFLEKDETETGLSEERLTTQQVRKEAMARRKVRQAQQKLGSLEKRLLASQPDKQIEPKRQYAHFDHLLVHAIQFQKLLKQETRDHRRKAEVLAHEARRYVEAKQLRSKVKTVEEIEQEKRDACLLLYRTVVKDVEKLWNAVRLEVEELRRKEYEDQQQAKMKGHLARVLDRTDQMLTQALEDDDSESQTDTDMSMNSDAAAESEDSGQMSESESDSDSEPDATNADAEMSLEELKKKYGDLPDLSTPGEVDDEADRDEDDEQPASVQPEDESDPETEMDSEFDTDESEGEGSEDGSGGSDESEQEDSDAEPTLLSMLFSKKKRAEIAQDADAGEDVGQNDIDPNETGNTEVPLVQVVEESEKVEAPTAARPNQPAELDHQHSPNQVDGDVEMANTGGTSTEISFVNRASTPYLHPDMARLTSEDPLSVDASAHTSPHTTATKVSDPESVSSLDVHNDAAVPATPSETKVALRTPVPAMLRGTLREYQHEGLDWLAELYAKGRSGILADEMGLGKTIQSISVLAHVAEVYENWGPHLIVVPTSVMLNWEMEFKKFLPGFKVLTYYGNQEERKAKRRGWMADDSFNVCITSYQLVLQDAVSFKRRRWHYMILDEAHNIKNFRSERWQTMMTFNTRARLLLTGTPLQNNLTELWSLLFFLHYGQENEGEDDAFAGLKEWSEWFKRPVESILEHGRQVLDEEDKEQVAKLHKVIRPFLLRRLKADVEKQMPLKYEHVEMCRLSKRQRQLYDGFMSRAQTKETLASGNYLSIINALMQLRKVCNHPDLFETRPINTSFAMSRSAAAEYEIKDFMVRRRFLRDASTALDLDFLQLVPVSEEGVSMIESIEATKRHAYHQFKGLREAQSRRVLSLNAQQPQSHNFHSYGNSSSSASAWRGTDRIGVLGSLENVGRRARLQELDRTMYYEAYRHHQHPIYGRGLIEQLTITTKHEQLSKVSSGGARSVKQTRWWEQSLPIESLSESEPLVHSVQTRAQQMSSFVDKYAFITPAVVATDLSTYTVTELGSQAIREQVQRELANERELHSKTSAATHGIAADASSSDPFHLARMKLSIAFPDKRLLQYDCGKLQRLDKLLRQLQTGGHRALIFTQMTKVLDILEQFLNIHGHRYLRLDGATKIEQRQILTERFNNDNRILCFILSSRSGGLGINLTGADTVIFYDLDWNPAMDKQCTDRAHRIGQTRDVHIYRFVSEHTIESNILRKANQKQLLDDVVIQEGDFTTDYISRMNYRDMLPDSPDSPGDQDEAGKAMDRLLGNTTSTTSKVLEEAEDQEDRAAANVATRELQNADEGDFDDSIRKDSRTPITAGAKSGVATMEVSGTDGEGEGESGRWHHIDEYLLQLQKYLMKDIPLGPGKDAKRKKGRKRDEHRVRRRH
jgi:helicase SWR1